MIVACIFCLLCTLLLTRNKGALPIHRETRFLLPACMLFSRKRMLCLNAWQHGFRKQSVPELLPWTHIVSVTMVKTAVQLYRGELIRWPTRKLIEFACPWSRCLPGESARLLGFLRKAWCLDPHAGCLSQQRSPLANTSCSLDICFVWPFVLAHGFLGPCANFAHGKLYPSCPEVNCRYGLSAEVQIASKETFKNDTLRALQL